MCEFKIVNRGICPARYTYRCDYIVFTEDFSQDTLPIHCFTLREYLHIVDEDLFDDAQSADILNELFIGLMVCNIAGIDVAFRGHLLNVNFGTNLLFPSDDNLKKKIKDTIRSFVYAMRDLNLPPVHKAKIRIKKNDLSSSCDKSICAQRNITNETYEFAKRTLAIRDFITAWTIRERPYMQTCNIVENKLIYTIISFMR